MDGNLLEECEGEVESARPVSLFTPIHRNEADRVGRIAGQEEPVDPLQEPVDSCRSQSICFSSSLLKLETRDLLSATSDWRGRKHGLKCILISLQHIPPLCSIVHPPTTVTYSMLRQAIDTYTSQASSQPLPAARVGEESDDRCVEYANICWVWTTARPQPCCKGKQHSLAANCAWGRGRRHTRPHLLA